MPNRKALLSRLVETLVEEWGRDEVGAALAAISEKSPRSGQPGGRGIVSSSRAREQSRKPNAADLVERTRVDGERREVLLVIAEQFDRKQFLPSVADVREFLILSGERPGGLKDRSEAFRTLLQTLLELPEERLRDVSRAAMTAGPSQLGPISDAISQAGERIHRRQASSG